MKIRARDLDAVRASTLPANDLPAEVVVVGLRVPFLRVLQLTFYVVVSMGLLAALGYGLFFAFILLGPRT